MTFIGVIAFILHYFTYFDSFRAEYVTVVEDRPIMSAEYPLPLLAKSNPRSSRTVTLRQLSYFF